MQKEDDKGDQLLQDAERGISKAMIPKLKICIEGRARGKESEIVQIIRKSLIDHVSIEQPSKDPDVGILFYDVPGRLSTNIVIEQLDKMKGNDMAVILEIKPQISIRKRYGNHAEVRKEGWSLIVMKRQANTAHKEYCSPFVQSIYCLRWGQVSFPSYLEFHSTKPRTLKAPIRILIIDSCLISINRRVPPTEFRCIYPAASSRLSHCVVILIHAGSVDDNPEGRNTTGREDWESLERHADCVFDMVCCVTSISAWNLLDSKKNQTTVHQISELLRAYTKRPGSE